MVKVWQEVYKTKFRRTYQETNGEELMDQRDHEGIMEEEVIKVVEGIAPDIIRNSRSEVIRRFLKICLEAW